MREATKTPPSRGRIPDFFTLFQVHEPRRQSQCHRASIRRRWHYFKISTPATIQRGPGGLQSTATTDRHHRLLDRSRWLRCPAPVPAHAARPLRAISTLISVSFLADDALQTPEISKILDHRSTIARDLIRDGSDAPGCVRRPRADALVPLGAISTPVVSTGTTPPPEPKFGIFTKTGIRGWSWA